MLTFHTFPKLRLSIMTLCIWTAKIFENFSWNKTECDSCISFMWKFFQFKNHLLWLSKSSIFSPTVPHRVWVLVRHLVSWPRWANPRALSFTRAQNETQFSQVLWEVLLWGKILIPHILRQWGKWTTFASFMWKKKFNQPHFVNSHCQYFLLMLG